MANLHPDVIDSETSKLILETYIDANLLNAKKRNIGRKIEYTVKGKSGVNKLYLSQKNNSWFANTFSPTLASSLDMSEGRSSYVLSIWDVFRHNNIDNEPIKQKEYITSLGGTVLDNGFLYKSVQKDLTATPNKFGMTILQINAASRIIYGLLKDDDYFLNNLKSIVYTSINFNYLTENPSIDEIIANSVKRLKTYPGHDKFASLNYILTSTDQQVEQAELRDFLNLDRKVSEYIKEITKSIVFKNQIEELNQIKERLDLIIDNINQYTKPTATGRYIDKLLVAVQKSFNLNSTSFIDFKNNIDHVNLTNEQMELINKIAEIEKIFNLDEVFFVNQFTIKQSNIDIRSEVIENMMERLSIIDRDINNIKAKSDFLCDIISKDYQKNSFLKLVNDKYKYISNDVGYTYLMKKNNLLSVNHPKDIISNVVEEVYTAEGAKIKINSMFVPYYNMKAEEQCFQKIRPNKGYYYDSNKEVLVEDKQTIGPATGCFRVIGEQGNPSELIKKLNSGERQPLILVEGLATGQSFANIGIPVIVCMNAGNIKEVIHQFSEKYSNIDFIVAGEKDKYVQRNEKGLIQYQEYGTNEKMAMSSLKKLGDNNLVYVLSGLLHRDSLDIYLEKKNNLGNEFNESKSIPYGTDYNDAAIKFGNLMMVKEFCETTLKEGSKVREYRSISDGISQIFNLPPLSNQSIETVSNIVNNYISNTPLYQLKDDLNSYGNTLDNKVELDILKFLANNQEKIKDVNLNIDNINIDSKLYKFINYYEINDHNASFENALKSVGFDEVEIASIMNEKHPKEFSYEEISRELIKPNIFITDVETEIIKNKIIEKEDMNRNILSNIELNCDEAIIRIEKIQELTLSLTQPPLNFK